MATVDRGAERVERVEAALSEVERLADPAAAETAFGAVEALLDLYGEGLARLLACAGEEAAATAVEDELVAHLLLLHGLHPVPVEERVARALDEVRPYLESHGGGVELLDVSGGVAHVRLHGTCDGCPSSAVTLRHAVEDAVHRAAPEIERVEAEGAPSPAGPGSVLDGLPTLPLVQAGPQADAAALPLAQAAPETDGHVWGVLHDVDVPPSATRVEEVLGSPVLLANADGTLYAYAPLCPSCGRSLGDGALDGGELTCGGCARRYDLRRAGRPAGAGDPGLVPMPLLPAEAGAVRIAVGSVGAR